jgi:sarcosine oxidase
VDGSLESCRLYELRHELIDARELRRRYPGYGVPPGLPALLQPDGGFLLAERTLLAHTNQALRHGADLHFHEPVRSWQTTAAGGVEVRTDRFTYVADRLVICAGAWAGGLVPQLASLATPERQVLAWLQPTRPELFEPDRFPVFVLDVDDGSYYGFPVHDVPGFKIGRYHHLREPMDPDDPDRSTHPEDEAILRAFAARYFPEGAGDTILLKTCIFTNSPDEHFLIDRLPDAPQVGIAAGFSGHGYKFCSLVGEVMADLAIDGQTRHDIGLFSLTRFAA